MLSGGIVLLHDPHTAAATHELLDKFGWEIFDHPPYSPDLAPSDFHLFHNLKEFLGCKCFGSDEKLENAVTIWFNEMAAEEYDMGILKLVDRYDKRLNVGVSITFWGTPEHQVGKEGSDFMVLCNVRSDPSPIISWYVNGSLILDGPKYTITEDGLYIRNLKPTDYGNYTCRAFVVTPHSSQMKDRDITVLVHCTCDRAGALGPEGSRFEPDFTEDPTCMGPVALQVIRRGQTFSRWCGVEVWRWGASSGVILVI
ncbi:hypothetical protein AVEN_88850-1 [Araneus ventricosus]|uniref:Ig-like domain-containing protein n=1 Tax=Araneus ventricosus TaxID=182803 RepID=A0A4Y2T826_ARAVE|nr:hypothetical protein AVEN_88850-1 [Araneus ventricosus]